MAIFVVITTAVFAQTRASAAITPGPSKDNTLIENGSGALSNGAGQHIFVGRTGQGAGSSIRRAVLAFDVSGVPLGATIDSVSLRLNMSKTPSGAQTVSAHRLTADWGEGNAVATGGGGIGGPAASGDATWIHRFSNSTNWTSPGGDFVSSASASQTVSGIGAYSWSSTQMVADVQAWVNASSTNFGWLLKGNESSSRTAKRFDSRQNSNASNRPALTITYTLADPTPTPTPVPGTRTWGLILIAGLLAVAGLWKTRGQRDTHSVSR
ncbi:MAG: DNRLRE domain-containing protein [Chloroflexi bacterium]|nr:DNRLRE domain-containing protein [Chloroflexota bacterium]